MHTSTLNALTEQKFEEVLTAFKNLIGKELYINSIHAPLVRLLLPILISAEHDDRKIHNVLVPDFKPSSTGQIKAAIFDKKFYEFLVNLVKGQLTTKSQIGIYEFYKVRLGTLKVPKQKVLIFRANFSYKELLKIFFKSLSLLRRAKIPNVIVDKNFRYKQPEYSSDACQNFANIIYSLTPTNLNENLKSNLKVISKNNVFFSKIYSNSAYIDNDIFKLICHSCSQRGGEVIIGQHGGGWNINKISNERQMIFDFATSVRFWTHNFSTNKKKLKNKINVRLKRFKPAKLDRKKAVFIEYAWPKHRVSLASIPQEEEVEDMFSENAIFLQNASIDLEVALYPDFDFLSRQSLYSRNAGDNISFKPQQKSIHTLLSQSNLIITSVLNTVFYQALMSNYPLVIWFAPGYKIDDYFSELFEELEKCRIFHKSAASCANFINEVDLDVWWNSDTVKKNIKKLKYSFLGI